MLGDIKYSYHSTDHDDWYLCDGRHMVNLTGLTSTQKLTAAQKISTFLPDLNGKYLSMDSNQSTGTTFGPSSLVHFNTGAGPYAAATGNVPTSYSCNAFIKLT